MLAWGGVLEKGAFPFVVHESGSRRSRCAPRMLVAARVAVSGPRDVPTVLIRLLDSVYAFLKNHPSARQTG